MGKSQRLVISDPKKKERKHKPELYLTVNEPEKVRLTYSPYVSGDHETATYVWDFARDDKKINACLKEIFSAMQDGSWKKNISDTLEKKFSLKKTVDKEVIDEELVEKEAADYVHEPK
jgi:hypothetical protein